MTIIIQNRHIPASESTAETQKYLKMCAWTITTSESFISVILCKTNLRPPFVLSSRFFLLKSLLCLLLYADILFQYSSFLSVQHNFQMWLLYCLQTLHFQKNYFYVNNKILQTFSLKWSLLHIFKLSLSSVTQKIVQQDQPWVLITFAELVILTLTLLSWFTKNDT